MQNIECLTDYEILLELLEYYDLDKLADMLYTTKEYIANCLHSRTMQNSKIRHVFDEHVSNNKKHISIVDALAISQTNKVLVNSPDGFQGIKQWVVKKPRQIFEIVTKSLKKLKCSNDHLIETARGWVLTENLKIGDSILTKDGFENLEHKHIHNVEKVYDFEVEHPNHRYFAGDGISSHNTGKTFLACNLIKNAQIEGAFTLFLDSENALDKGTFAKLGIKTDRANMLYMQVVTINDVVKALSEFFNMYFKKYGKNNPDAPSVMIVLDSIDMLLTDKENEDFESGIQKGDQGQRTKQLKHTLRTLVSRVAKGNISFLATHQVYANQDVLNGEGRFIVNNAVRYSASQIILVNKLKLKEGTEVMGIRMRAEAYKSRFAKIGSTVDIEVPYAKGMNPFSGLLETLVEKKVVTQGGAWYTFNNPDGDPIKFQRKNMTKDFVMQMLAHPIVLREEMDITQLIEDDDFALSDEIAELEDSETVYEGIEE